MYDYLNSSHPPGHNHDDDDMMNKAYAGISDDTNQIITEDVYQTVGEFPKESFTESFTRATSDAVTDAVNTVTEYLTAAQKRDIKIGVLVPFTIIVLTAVLSYAAVFYAWRVLTIPVLGTIIRAIAGIVGPVLRPVFLFVIQLFGKAKERFNLKGGNTLSDVSVGRLNNIPTWLYDN